MNDRVKLKLKENSGSKIHFIIFIFVILMNSVIKILSVFIALTFLVSATGVFYVKHTCLHSGKTNILLGEKHDCCEQHMGNNSCCDQNSEDNSCPVHGEHRNCCVNDVVYLKGNSEYQKSETRISVEEGDYQLFKLRLTNIIAFSEYSQFNSIPTPPFEHPREVLIKNNILIL